MALEQVVVKDAIYLSGKSTTVTNHLRSLLAVYGDIPVAYLIRLLQQ